MSTISRRDPDPEEPRLEPTERTIRLYETHREDIEILAQREDTIGALARAHRQVVEEVIDEC